MMGQRTRTCFAVAVVVVAVCTITSCGWFGDEPAEEPALGRIDREPIGSGPLVVVLGDSLTVQTRDALVDDMSDRSLLIAGISGEGWTGGVFSRDNPGDPPIVAAGLEYAALDPAVAVLALGTNDAWSGDLPAASSVAQIDRVVGALDGSSIISCRDRRGRARWPDFDGAVVGRQRAPPVGRRPGRRGTGRPTGAGSDRRRRHPPHGEGPAGQGGSSPSRRPLPGRLTGSMVRARRRRPRGRWGPRREAEHPAVEPQLGLQRSDDVRRLPEPGCSPSRQEVGVGTPFTCARRRESPPGSEAPPVLGTLQHDERPVEAGCGGPANAPRKVGRSSGHGPTSHRGSGSRTWVSAASAGRSATPW